MGLGTRSFVVIALLLVSGTAASVLGSARAPGLPIGDAQPSGNQISRAHSASWRAPSATAGTRLDSSVVPPGWDTREDGGTSKASPSQVVVDTGHSTPSSPPLAPKGVLNPTGAAFEGSGAEPSTAISPSHETSTGETPVSQPEKAQAARAWGPAPQFSTPGTVLSTAAASGPTYGYWNSPSMVEDASGNIYVAFPESTANGYRIYYDKYAQGTGWAGAVQADGGGGVIVSGWDDYMPSIDVYGSSVCIAFEDMKGSTSTYRPSGDYFVTCNTGSGWTTPIGDTTVADHVCPYTSTVAYGPYSVAAAFDSAGNFIVAIIGDYYTTSNCDTSGGFAAGTIFAKYTSAGAFSSAVQVADTSIEGSGTSGLFSYMTLNCAVSSSICVYAYASTTISGSNYPNQYLYEIYSTTDFSSYSSPYLVTSETCASAVYPYLFPFGGDSSVAIQASGSLGGLVFAFGESTCASYDAEYAYTSNGFVSMTVSSNYPTGSSTSTGIYWASLALVGTSTAVFPFISYQYLSTTSTDYVVTSSSQSGAFTSWTSFSASAAAAGGTAIAFTSASAAVGCAAYRADLVYFGPSTSFNAYFTSTLGPCVSISVTSPVGGQDSADNGQSIIFSATGSNGLSPYTPTWGISSGATYLTACATGGTSPTFTYTCTVSVAATQTAVVWVYLKDTSGCYAPPASGTLCSAPTTGTSVTVTLYQDPTLSAVTETSPVSCSSGCSADQGQTLTVTATASLGTGVYTYTWSITAGSTYCSGTSTTSALSCSVGALSATQTWTATVYVTDSDLCKAPSPCAGGTTNSLTLSLYQDPALAAIAETSPVACSSGCSADQGQTLTVTTSASLGSGVYTYTWSITAGSTYCSGSSTTSTLSCTVGTLSATQTWTVTAFVTDSNGCRAPTPCSGTTLSFTVSLYEDPTISAVTETSPKACSSTCSADQGQTLTVTSTASLGSGGYVYTWSITAGSTYCSGSSTASTLSCTVGSLTATQTWTVTVYVTDSDGCKAPTPCSGGTNSFTVSLYQDPTLSAISETSPKACSSTCSADQGQTLTVTSTASLGSGGYVYTWSITAGSTFCSGSSTASTLSCTVGSLTTAQTTWTVTVYVTDSNGCKAPSPCSGGTTSFTASLYQDPTLTAIVESSPVACAASCSADQGQALSVATTASLGSGSYTFTWTLTAGSTYCSGSASGATTSTYSCTVGTISTTQTWTVTVDVADSNGCVYPTPCGGGTLSITISLLVDPSISSITGNPLSGGVEAGQSLTLTAAAAGGSGSYTAWSWTSLPTGCTNSAAASLTCTPTVGGAYTITVQADDTNNYGPVSLSVNFIIQPAGSMIPSTRTPFTPVRAGITGATASFNTTATGGTGNYTLYTWSESSPNLGCILANSAIIYCSPLTPGNYTVSVQVTDSDNATSRVRTSSNWEVNGTLYPGFVTMAANVVDLGQSVGLQTSSPYGGSPAYTYAWRSGTSTTCANDPLIPGASFPVYTASPVSTSFYCVSFADNSSGTPPPVVYSNVVLIAVNPVLVAGSATPASPAIDLGQSLVLSSAASGGTSPYAIAWYSSASGTGPCDSGTVLGTSSTLVLSPSASSYYCYVVTDSSGGSPTAVASSTWDLVVVDPALVAGPIAPQPVILDQGQSATLYSNPGGGTTPYAVTWFSSTTGTGSCKAGAWVAASSSVLISPSASGYYCYELTDGSQGTPAADSLSGWELVVVSPALVAGSLSPSSATLDVGQTLTLTTSSPSGGSPGYTYQWYSGSSSSCSSDSPILGQTQVSLTALASASTYYCMEYGDSSMGAPVATVYSITVLVAVNPALVAGAPSPATVSTDFGLSLSLSATVSGGTPGYSYQWYTSPAPGTCNGTDSVIFGATSSLLTTAPSLSAGIHFFCYAVADSSDAIPMAVFSSTATVTIYPDPLLSAVAQVGPTRCTSGCVVDASQILSVSTTASLGNGGYVFRWQITSGGSACAGAATGSSVSIYSCTVGILSHAQVWTITVSVTDGLGCTYPSPCGGGSSLAFSVTLYPAPSLTSPVQNSPVVCASNCSADQGQTLAIETIASGGSGAYSFSWAVTRGSAVCSGQGTGAPVSIYTCTVAAVSVPQTWEVSVIVTDLSGCSFPDACAGGTPLTFSLTLEPDPTVSISASPVSGSAGPGEMLSFAASANGGSGSYVGWTWSSLPPGCSSSGSAVDSCLASAGGVYTVAVSVRDSDGFGPFNASMSYIVAPTTPAPSVGVPVADSVSGEVGRSVSFSTNASGGSGSYSSYSWSESVSGFGCSLSFASAISCVPLIAGDFTVAVYVVDSLGHASHSRTSAVFSVASNPALPTVSLSASRSTVPVSETVLLTASITGGITPYSVQWFLNGGVLPGVNGGTYVFVPSSTGTFDFYVVITDGSGARVMSASLAIQSISGPSSPHLSFIQTSDGVWAWVVGGLSAILLLEFALWNLVVQRNPTPSASDQPRYAATAQNRTEEKEGNGALTSAKRGEL